MNQAGGSVQPAWHSAAAVLVGFAVLCLVLVAGGLFWKPPPWTVSIDAGAAQTTPMHERVVRFAGFYQGEQMDGASGRSFRWTSRPQAMITFHAAQRMQPLMFSLTACGCHEAAPATPFSLALNGRPMFTEQAPQTWRTYHVLAADTPAWPEYGLTAALHTPTRTTEEGRTVGLAVERVALRQLAPAPRLAGGSLLLLLAALGVLFWRRHSLAQPLLLAGCWLLVGMVYQPQILPRWLLLAVLICSLLALWWLADQIYHTVVSLVLPAVLVVWLVLSPQILGGWLLDDAYISFRYARHLVQGHGLVYNVGERVEGYTNFLWTLLLAGAMRLHIEPVLASQVLTLACGSGLLLLTVWLASRLMPPLWAWSAAGLLALNTPFLLYTSRGSGMETALFSLLTLATLAALVGRRWWLAGTLAALTMLTRPDGLIVAAVGGLYALLRSRAGQRASSTLHEPGTRNIPAALLAYTAPLLLIYLPYFLWRWSYYGYLLPNTFYAKVGGTTAQVLRGLGYLWDVGRGDALFLAAGVGFALGLWGWRRAADQGARWPEIGLLSGFTVLFSLYVVAVGGDWMPGARFFVPLIPVLAILTAWGLAGIAQGAPSLAAPALVVWVALAAALTLRLPLDSSYHPGSLVRREVGVVRHYRDVGHWIEQHTPPDTLIVAGPAGALPYYARRPTIDALGLNDEHIAHSSPAALGTGKAGHEKTDPDYVLARQPQVIPWSAAAYLRGHPALEQGYRLEQVIGPEGAEVRLFVRRDLPLLSGARRLNNAALLMMAADDAVKVPEQQRR